jgi:hypothetical protein
VIVPVPRVGLVVLTVQPVVAEVKLYAPVPEPPVIARLTGIPAVPEAEFGARVKAD